MFTPDNERDLSHFYSGLFLFLLCTLAPLAFFQHFCLTFLFPHPPDLSTGSEMSVGTLTFKSEIWSYNICALSTELSNIILPWALLALQSISYNLLFSVSWIVLVL